MGYKSDTYAPDDKSVLSKLISLKSISNEKIAVVVLSITKIAQLAISNDLVVLDAVSALVILTIMCRHHDITQVLALVGALSMSFHLRHSLEINYFQPLGMCELAAYILVITLLTKFRSILCLIE